MKLGFSGEAFGNLLVLLCLIMIAVICLIYFVSYRRGIDITRNRFVLPFGIGSLIIFCIIPFWFSDLTIKAKIIGTILIISGGIGNYFAIDKMQRAIRERRSKKQERNTEGSP
jgi:predicted RND superfamily exporter protein